VVRGSRKEPVVLVELGVVEQRYRAVLEVLDGVAVTDVARRFGVSRQTVAETTVGSFKNELIRRQGPRRDVDHVELGTTEWVIWFNTERPHDELDDFTSEAVEKLHYDHRQALQEAG
jgi:transposase-like protein